MKFINMDKDLEPIPCHTVDQENEERSSIAISKDEIVTIMQTTSPKILGRCIALLYRNGNPLITIGPNCIIVTRAILFLRCINRSGYFIFVFTLCYVEFINCRLHSWIYNCI